MPKYIKKSKPSWANLKYFKPWSSIGEKIRDKFTRKNSAEIHEIADENHTEDINLQAGSSQNSGNENINSNTSSLSKPTKYPLLEETRLAPRFWRCNFCSKQISGEPLRIK